MVVVLLYCGSRLLAWCWHGNGGGVVVVVGYFKEEKEREGERNSKKKKEYSNKMTKTKEFGMLDVM